MLNQENYYDLKKEYLSVSQYKDFMGSYGVPGCEARAMAVINGEWEEAPNTAMLVGSYVDAYFSDELEEFKASHPECFKKDGSLKAEYVKAEKCIERATKDELFMSYMSGEKQVIMTGEIFGSPWKIKMDSYIPDTAIVDLKVMTSISEPKWVKDLGYLDFVRYWGYDIQGAVYQEIVRQNTGKTLPFYIAAIGKGDEPDIQVIHVADRYLKEAMEGLRPNVPYVQAIKDGCIPLRCERCDYCKHTRVLTEAIELEDLL